MTAQGPDHALSLEVRPVAIAASQPHIEAPTQETGTLPRVAGARTGRRASITMPRIAPGRYLAVEDGDDIVLYALERPDAHRAQPGGGHRARRCLGVAPARAGDQARGGDRDPRRPQPQRRDASTACACPRSELADGDTITVGHVAMRYVERI